MTDSDDQTLRFSEDGGCFGCSPSNPVGLQLTFRRRGDTIATRYAIPDRFHGAPGIAHGGIVATLLDEVSCAAVFFSRDRYVVTGELTVRFERPCPVLRPVEVAARITGEHPRYLVVEGTVHDGESLVARSQGKFFLQNRPESAP
jgi:acyl-coenzyme A thioesterase PaaI-like protein